MPSVECPFCGEYFPDAAPDEGQTETESSNRYEHEPRESFHATVESWRQLDPRHPYSGGQSMSHEEVQRNIQRIGATIDIDGQTFDFEFYQKPEDDSHFWTHVARTQTDAGQKSKNAVVTETGDLFLKNRGIPWNEDKSWTQLSRAQLKERSAIAGLGQVIEVPDTRGGLGVLLDERYRPLVYEGFLQEDLVCKLAKAVLVFQSEENPVG